MLLLLTVFFSFAAQAASTQPLLEGVLSRSDVGERAALPVGDFEEDRSHLESSFVAGGRDLVLRHHGTLPGTTSAAR
jgi:hypothetical protein